MVFRVVRAGRVLLGAVWVGREVTTQALYFPTGTVVTLQDKCDMILQHKCILRDKCNIRWSISVSTNHASTPRSFRAA